MLRGRAGLRAGVVAALRGGNQPRLDRGDLLRRVPLSDEGNAHAYYRALLEELRIHRFEPVRRRYGEDHVVDESILHATAEGRPLGLEGRGRRVRVRLLHVFDFGDGLITRESAWLDIRELEQQLAA